MSSAHAFLDYNIQTICKDIFETLKNSNLTQADLTQVESLLTSTIEMMQREYEANPQQEKLLVIQNLASYMKSKLDQKEFKESKPLTRMQEQLDILVTLMTTMYGGVQSKAPTSHIPDDAPMTRFAAPARDLKEQDEKDRKDMKDQKDSKRAEREDGLDLKHSIAPAPKEDYKTVQNNILDFICNIESATVDQMKEIATYLALKKPSYIALCRQNPTLAEEDIVLFESIGAVAKDRAKSDTFNGDLAKITGLLEAIVREVNDIVSAHKAKINNAKTNPAHAHDAKDAKIDDLDEGGIPFGAINYNDFDVNVSDPYYPTATALTETAESRKQTLIEFFDRRAYLSAYFALALRVNNGVYDQSYWTPEICELVLRSCINIYADEKLKNSLTRDELSQLMEIQKLATKAVSSLRYNEGETARLGLAPSDLEAAYHHSGLFGQAAGAPSGARADQELEDALKQIAEMEQREAERQDYKR